MTDTLSLANRFQALAHPDYWQRLAPKLHAGSPSALSTAAQAVPFDQAVLAGVNSRLLQEGYFQLPPPAWNLDIAALAQGVSAVKAASHLPVFAFMYDEAWLLYTRLRELLAGVLGETYMMLPAFWIWHVDGKSEQAGWTPHRDHAKQALFPDGTPKALTLWIPLTDATPLNGCMYVLPADRDSMYASGEHVIATPLDVQDVRALPSPAGGVLGWTQAIYHWGGRAGRNLEQPRISISIEFQRGDEMPINEPLLPPDEIPSLEDRLRLILRQILQYKHMYPLTPELEALANAYANKAQARTEAAPKPKYGIFRQ